MTTTPDAAVPEITLDPYGSDHHGEAARLRALGPVVRVRLPGDVRAWAVTRHDLLAEAGGRPAHEQGLAELERHPAAARSRTAGR